MTNTLLMKSLDEKKLCEMPLLCIWEDQRIEHVVNDQHLESRGNLIDEDLEGEPNTENLFYIVEEFQDNHQIVVNDPVRQQDKNQNAIILEVENVENVPLLAWQQEIRDRPHSEPLNNNYDLDDVKIDPQIRDRMDQFFERFEGQNQERINEIQQRVEAIRRRHEREMEISDEE
jgi:hypothetical protein